MITRIEISCSSVCAVYVEEGKENWQNIDDAFQWLRRYTHEAGDSVMFCTRHKLHGFSQPPTLMWLSHKLSLLALIYLCITVVANSIQKRSYVQEEVTVLARVDGTCCMADFPFQLC